MITKAKLISRYEEVARELVPRYVFTDNIMDGVDKFARYLLSNQKIGVRVSGGVGSGKSKFMEIWSNVLRGTDKYFKIVRCQDIVEEYKEYGDDVITKYALGVTGVGEMRYMFDDLGDEKIIPNYGERVNVMEMILSKKHFFLMNGVSKKYPHYTTNISDDDLTLKYGERVSDRLVEISAVLILNDKSWRGR